MSYHQGGHYQGGHQQHSQQPPQQGYWDNHNQYHPPPQNGGYQPQYGQEYAQPYEQQQTNSHPGQTSYNHYQGGPVQQQQPSGYGYQDQLQSPRSTTFGYNSPPQQGYNPQDYSQHSQPASAHPQQQSYNPAAYANFHHSQSQSSYDPAAYPDTQLHSTSGPVDPYAYSSPSYSQPPMSPQQQPQYAQSPQSHFSSRQQYSPQPPARQYTGYQPTQSPPPPQHSHYAYPQAQPGASQTTPYPADGHAPHSGSNSLQRQPTMMPSNDPWAPSPPAHQGGGSFRQSPSQNYGSYQQPSPLSSTPGPTPPAHAPSRSNTLDRHPHERPLPPQPHESDYFDNHSASRTHTGFSRDDELDNDALFEEVENAVRNAGRGSVGARSPSISISQAPFQPPAHAPSFSSSRDSRASRNGTVNGHLSPVVPQHVTHEAQYSSDSDAEATQGLAMIAAAEAEDARRISSGSQVLTSNFGSQRAPRQYQRHPEASDSDINFGVDMSSITGYDVGLSYGGDPSQLAAGGELNGEVYSQNASSQHSSMRRSHASQSSQMSRVSYGYGSESIHPFPPFNPAARVEVGGTGGLEEPTADGRRQSYDEGDEYSLMENGLPDRFPDEPPDIFFNHASTSYPSRPLPAVPYSATPPLGQHEAKALPPLPGQPPYPTAPEAYMRDAQGQYVPRSTSLVSHSNTPQVPQPLRSKTDAEERRLRQQQARTSMYSSEQATPASASVVVDLPAIAKRFAPSKLGAPDFKKCDEPWSLMSLLKWLIVVTNPEQNTELKEADVKEALVALFTNKVPTMNITDAEVLSSRVVTDMYQAGTLVRTEEWVKIVPGFVSGVIFQLTQSGCYTPTVHDHLIPSMRCYSPKCQKSLKKVNLQTLPAGSSTKGWADYYGLSKEDIDGKDKKVIELQNVLHEVVTSEEVFMSSINVLRTVFRDPLGRSEPAVITPKRKDKFVKDVFGKVDAVKLANEEHLLPQLKYRQMEQGPWIVGFSDIFRQWIRKAKSAYIDYANDFPRADHLVRQELDRNIEFRNFVERAQKDKATNRLPLDNFLKAPILRLQRYPFLIQSVLKNMKDESQEKKNLEIACDEIKAVALECDHRVSEMQRKVDLADLGQRLILRPGMQKEVELNLEHFGRQLYHRGDLQRMGNTRFTWLDCHTLLFDHYLILAKTVAQTVTEGGKTDRYDVSRLPIPMDLLILESVNDPPVQKSSYIRGIASVREAAGRTSTPMDPGALTRTATNQSPAPGGLTHVNTAASTNSLNPVTSLGEGKDADRILYPLKIKHLGRESYTLFALTQASRDQWVEKIVEAKTKHAAALHAQNAEPFRLRVMADSAFVYDAFGGSGKGVTIKGTPVDRAIKEVEHRFKDTGRPGPICRARVNCATSFSTPYPGKQMVAVGTDFGVYFAELDNPRGWTKAISMTRVIQVAVLEEFNLFLLISDKSLIAYHLDVICPSDRTAPAPARDDVRKAPQKLSGSRDVGFFVTGKMKERTLVFYKKRENLNSVFKVLEPVYQKSTEKKRTGLFKRGNIEFFRDFDEFYVPTECSGMNLFQSSLAVSTSRGFEVLTLDKKQPWSVPELKAEHVQNIAHAIKEQRPISMLRLSDQEFILCYEKCAVYVNKHGDVSRSVVMNFVGVAQNAALYGPYLVLFDNDFVEIRNAQNGRLKQIIAGREVKCLDDGTNWSANGPPQTNGIVNGPTAQASRTLKLVMQHPEQDKTQIVVELLLNENMKE
ncbi:hypothetical protein M409DRAFT_26244 [Zasmidium cellare ATCC 36951]|uniref:Uncharacterized protein n=1 Tax=Zasmidium cellare ATCC 36951 TaxID=1080233 RepID=A0A6A6CAE7_ZASCE|nr:uncharacterized protein M409DRAFT_26244 [Zasmidium cellare ATCC 36951]KAF2163200.1 hypothetical protein M409DRAFT_26244 [Zasmidium cellare ATCC 36951]